jgi:MFS family permease
MPTMMTEIVEISDNRNLGQIMAIASAPALFAPILSPVLGGIIVNSLRRWIFYVNITVTFLAFIRAIRSVPADKLSGNKQSLDAIGVLLLSPALAILIYGIAQISKYGGLNDRAAGMPIALGVVRKKNAVFAGLWLLPPGIGMLLTRGWAREAVPVRRMVITGSFQGNQR